MASRKTTEAAPVDVPGRAPDQVSGSARAGIVTSGLSMAPSPHDALFKAAFGQPDIGRRVGECIVALLDSGVVAFKFGGRWRVRFPRTAPAPTASPTEHE